MKRQHNLYTGGKNCLQERNSKKINVPRIEKNKLKIIQKTTRTKLQKKKL